jgi:hypothetical protein
MSNARLRFKEAANTLEKKGLVVAGGIYIAWGTPISGCQVSISHSQVSFHNAERKLVQQNSKERYTAEGLQKSRGDGDGDHNEERKFFSFLLLRSAVSVIFPPLDLRPMFVLVMGPLFTRLCQWTAALNFICYSRHVSKLVSPPAGAKPVFRKKMSTENNVRKYASSEMVAVNVYAPSSTAHTTDFIRSCLESEQPTLVTSVVPMLKAPQKCFVVEKGHELLGQPKQEPPTTAVPMGVIV